MDMCFVLGVVIQYCINFVVPVAPALAIGSPLSWLPWTPDMPPSWSVVPYFLSLCMSCSVLCS